LHSAAVILTQNETMNLNAMTAPPKKSKAPPTDWNEANKACRTPAEREQLALVVRAGWTSDELIEYARLYFFRNGRDYATPTSFRRAIADVAGCTLWLDAADQKPSYRHPFSWLKLFRKGGSKLVPPRRESLLQRGRGLTHRISDEEYGWPGHTEEFRSMIEQRARDYFKIAPEQPVHVNAWAASKRAYDRDQSAQALASRRETEAIRFSLAPKSRKKSSKAPRRKLVSSFDYSGGKLKPHFNLDFEGHTPAFREEVAALARKDNGLRPNAHISPHRWKVACHKHYVLIDVAAG
jgi:hypothetical protein